MKPLLSIVMAYHDRKPLLLQTLKSISYSSEVAYTEIIIVDDGSSENHRLDNITEEVIELTGKKLDIKVIRIEPENKWYSNPCIPYNIGFKQAQGDIIVIQNPECYHLGDVLSIAAKIEYNQYYSFFCYSLDEAATQAVKDIDLPALMSMGLGITGLHETAGVAWETWLRGIVPFWPLQERAITHEGGLGYYNHSVYRPVSYHFCSAIPRTDLQELGGFDERYAEGVAYDDDEFIARIRRKGMEVHFPVGFDRSPYPMVLHQNHYKESKEYGVWEGKIPENKARLEKNYNLYHQVTLQETEWRANVK